MLRRSSVQFFLAIPTKFATRQRLPYPSLNVNDNEIAGHLLTLIKLPSSSSCSSERLGIAQNCNPTGIANLLVRRCGMSWIEEEEEPSGEPRRRTIIFANRAIIRKVGGGRTTLRF